MRVRIFILVIGVLLALMAVGVNKLLNLPDDNPFEEMIEQELKDELGIDIDLTPNSPEE